VTHPRLEPGACQLQPPGFDFCGLAGRVNRGFPIQLRDECLNVEVCFNLADARRKLLPEES
jgi:hypothetical protein